MAEPAKRHSVKELADLALEIAVLAVFNRSRPPRGRKSVAGTGPSAHPRRTSGEAKERNGERGEESKRIHQEQERAGIMSTNDKQETHQLAPEFLEMLVCPMGKEDLRLENDTLTCTRCGPVFRIEDGIPILLIEEAKLPESAASIEELPCQTEGSNKDKKPEA